MACCAFAVFLLTQLLAPFLWMRRKLLGETRRDNPAVAWSPGAPTSARPARRSRFRTALYVVVGLELAAGAAAFAWVLPPSPSAAASAAAIEAAAFDGSWCGGLFARWEGN